MAALTLSCFRVLCASIFLILLQISTSAAEYPGVIELVGYSNRRARTHFMPMAGRQLDSHTYAPPAAKTQADIETVKQNIEKYNKLLTLDTRNLPESQKDMLERIVERVARLKESLDVEETTVPQNQTEQTSTDEDAQQATTEASFSAELEAESETDPTLVLDETTLVHLQTSMDELAAAQAAVTAQTARMRELPTTTEQITELPITADQSNDANDDADDDSTESSSSSVEYDSTTDAMLTDVTDADDQYVAARSNNRAAITAADPVSAGTAFSSTPLSTTAGNQRTLITNGKQQKVRATKRPHTSTSIKGSAASSTPYKRQRPGSTTATVHKHTTTKHKVGGGGGGAGATITTAQPYQKFKPSSQQTKVTIDKLTVTPATTLSDSIHQRPAALVPHGIAPHGNSPAAAASASAAAAAAAAAALVPIAASHFGPAATTYSAAPATNYGAPAANEMLYDPQVNTSSIIDSLNNAREEFYQKQGVNGNNKNSNNDKKPSATAKPTKYHYYPHNQHIYLLPECAIQQVCNAVYVRLNYTQPLCACPSRYRDPCSASLNEDDQHTTKLVGDGKKKAITLAKTCEATTEMRECRSPKDWSLLALQNTRTGKSHYLVICRCPDHFKMEGPMAHDQPTYASVPGIRVFGMMCVKPGYSIHKPSSQPPKRYQLQKPFYRPSSSNPSAFSSNQYGTKDTYGRPTYGGSSASSSSLSGGNNNGYHHISQDTYQNQPQSSYQYLNRPENLHNSGSSSNFHHSDTLGNFNGGSIYGRTNERKGETPIQAATATETEEDSTRTVAITTSTPAAAAAAAAAGVESRTSLSEESLNSMETVEPVAVTNPAETEGKEREKRSLVEEPAEWVDDNQMPEFPWDRVIEFQQSIVWD